MEKKKIGTGKTQEMNKNINERNKHDTNEATIHSEKIRFKNADKIYE
jgi:hypothetical protein